MEKLTEFRDKELAEEREVLLKSRKELKKAKQKGRKEEQKGFLLMLTKEKVRSQVRLK